MLKNFFLNFLFKKMAKPAAIITAVFLVSFCYAKKFSGPSGTIRLESRTFGKTEFVPLLDLANSLGFSVKWFYEPAKIELRNKTVSVDLMADSKFVQINKSDIRKMNASIVFVKGEPLCTGIHFCTLYTSSIDTVTSKAENNSL